MRALRLMVDSRLDEKAALFVGEGGTMLAVPSAGDWAYVIWVKDGRAMAVKRANAGPADAPVLDPAKAKGDAVSEFRKAGADIHLKHDAHDLWLTPTPPLVGEVSLAQIQFQKPEYKSKAATYTPDAEAVRFIRSVDDSVEIVSFFGSWCTVCTEEMPKLIKTVESAGNPRLTVRYFAVSQDLKEPHEALKKYGVSATPSVLVFYRGRELGRIVEHPEKTVETDIASILKRAQD
jgi:thiol-disulfide isomerase/thioredoxin